jgi:hypothetical protein
MKDFMQINIVFTPINLLLMFHLVKVVIVNFFSTTDLSPLYEGAIPNKIN